MDNSNSSMLILYRGDLDGNDRQVRGSEYSIVYSRPAIPMETDKNLVWCTAL